MKKNNDFPGKIKIIGGIWKNYRVIVHNDVRPTTNFMRETLFNWLEPFIQNSLCLDCFAGTGILGIEAVSRNAKNVILLEISKNVSLQIHKNLKLINSHKIKLITTDSLSWLKIRKNKFDIVFLDPPFSYYKLNYIIFNLERYNHLINNSLIYIETSRFVNYKVPNYWIKYKEKIKKKVIYRLYKRYKI